MSLRLLLWVLIVVLSGCASPPAPVEDRSDRPAMRLQPDSHYRVRRGDTLYTIAFRFGLDHREVASWNGIAPPYTIYPDQVLRMSPPPRTTVTAPATRPSPKPVTREQAEPERAASTPQSRPASRPAPPTRPQAEPSPEASPEWQWPATGTVVRGFVANDPSRNGLDISGAVGDPVRAAAAGTVVYSGSGLIGYGELIIIKHSERLLSAYAHNRVRLVQEGDQVRAGQKIAEMGRNDRKEALLHFEIRTAGQPVDPRRYLPQR